MNTCGVEEGADPEHGDALGGQQYQQHRRGGPGQSGVGLDPGVGATPARVARSRPGIVRLDFAGVRRVHAFTTVGADPGRLEVTTASFAVPLPGLGGRLTRGRRRLAPDVHPSRPLTGSGPRCPGVAGTVCAACWPRCSPSGWFSSPWFPCPCGGRGRTPGNQSFQAKWADWLRSHHAAVLANAVEQYYYSHHAPPKGGRPARLNAVPAPAGLPPACGPSASPRAGLPPPRPVPLVVSPALPGEGQWTPGGCRRGRCAGHVRGPVPRRHRLHQPDHLGGVDRPHPAAGRAGAGRPGAGRDLARAARHHRASTGQPRWPPSTAGSGSKTPTAASTSTAARPCPSSPGRRRWSSTPTGGSISAPGGARSA